jgi:FkbM family methyltransferase
MQQNDSRRLVFRHVQGRLGGRWGVLDRVVLDPLAGVLHRLGRRHLAQGRKQLVVFAFDHIGHTINLEGLYERSELEGFMAWMSALGVSFQDSVVLDIGANIGNHSLFFAAHCMRVVAYEPNPRTFKVLSLNSELALNIDCRNKALSDASGRARLSQDPENIGASSLAGTAPREGGLLVDISALDDELDLGPVRLIKMDIEGHELKALKGAKGLIARTRPIILFEQHPRDFVDGRSEVIELLQSMGYGRFATVGKRPKFGGHPLARWLLTPLARLLVGESIAVEIHRYIKPDFYFFLVALPDWVKD